MLIKNKQIERAHGLLREALQTYKTLGLSKEIEEVQKPLSDIQ
jgi:hypothetical protein